MLQSFIFFVCGILLPLFLIVNGLIFGVRQRFFYILHPIQASKDIMKGKGGFKALSLALAGTLGIGNIVGVSSAILMGGSGSVFWMILSALVAMSIKYAETFFAVRYKRVKGGISYGGAPYYVKEAFQGKKGIFLACAFDPLTSAVLSLDEIEKMVKEAEQHAAEDKKIKEAVEARNHADALIHTTEKALKENGEKLSASDKEAIENAVKDLKDVLESNDGDKIKEKTDALVQVSLKMGEAMYKDAGTATGAGADMGAGAGAETPKSDDDGVVDADFEEVKK